ncbi:MAG: hypothetical protein QXK76_00640 [Candidatus Woesearchaeota archaeon]
MQNIKIDDILKTLKNNQLELRKDNNIGLREWIHEAWMHHSELNVELKNLRRILELNSSKNSEFYNKEHIVRELNRIVNDANVQIKILKNKYYKKFDITELDKDPLESTVLTYIEINSQLMKKLEELLSIIK